MMDFLNRWLTGITAVSILLALADHLMPKGSVKRIGKFAGGLLLILVIINPVLSVDTKLLAGTLATYRFELENSNSSIEVTNDRLKKIIIEDRTGAYIRDRAAQLGIDCSVAVKCHVNKLDQLYPKSVVVYGEMTQEQQEELARIIEAEIAISPEMQRFERTKKS